MNIQSLTASSMRQTNDQYPNVPAISDEEEFVLAEAFDFFDKCGVLFEKSPNDFLIHDPFYGIATQQIITITGTNLTADNIAKSSATDCQVDVTASEITLTFDKPSGEDKIDCNMDVVEDGGDPVKVFFNVNWETTDEVKLVDGTVVWPLP